MKSAVHWMKGVRKGLRTIAGLALLAVLAGGVLSPTTARAATAVKVDLKEMTVTASPTSVEAGTITFTAENKGTVPHEIVVLKTDLAPNALPARATDPNKVDEATPGIENVGEIDDTVLASTGATGTLTVDLVPGKYVIICNVSGHYKAGMRTGFTVTDASAPAPTAPAQQVAPAAHAPALPSTGSGTTASGSTPSPLIVLAITGVLLAALGGWKFARSRR